jgi:predicted acetyltransferase
VLVTCYKDNIGSAKTIQNNGGVLENEIDSSEEGKIMKKYWIDIK